MAGVVQETVPHALHMHCASRCLNLAVMATSAIQLRFETCGLHSRRSPFFFFQVSPKRQAALGEAIQSMGLASTKKKLVELCRTRWVARQTALVTFEQLHLPVASTLEAIRDEAGWKAGSLLAAVTNFGFLASFILTSRILSNIHALSTTPQENANPGHRESLSRG